MFEVVFKFPYVLKNEMNVSSSIVRLKYEAKVCS